MTSELPRPWPALWESALIKACPEDFRVDEQLGFEPEGEGEHLWLHVEKRGANTAWVATELARWAGVTERDVGYAGLKDRHAVTTQWFSLHLPGKEAPEAPPQSEEFKVLSAVRHRRKLQRGALSGNRFDIVVRDIQGLPAGGEERVAQLLAQRGVPNYFGQQRFGIDGGNLDAARRMFAGRRVSREKRSILLSAARSDVFNRILAARVAAGCWESPVEGEVFMLAGSASVFGPEPISDELLARAARGDVHPTGALWGQGTLRSESAARVFDLGPEQNCSDLLRGLEAAGLRQERRSLRLSVASLSVARSGAAEIRLAFTLPAGAYATTVLDALGPCLDGGRGRS